jgi:hypothetical protein
VFVVLELFCFVVDLTGVMLARVVANDWFTDLLFE